MLCSRQEVIAEHTHIKTIFLHTHEFDSIWDKKAKSHLFISVCAQKCKSTSLHFEQTSSPPFLMESSPYNVSIHASKQQDQEWSWTVRIQLGKDGDLPSAPSVRLNNGAVSPGAGGSVVWVETRSHRDWQGKMQQVKVHQGSHTRTHTAAAPHCWPSLLPQGNCFSCFPSNLHWQASDNCRYCDTFVGPEKDSAAAALMGILETPYPDFMLPVIDWHRQTFENRMQKTPPPPNTHTHIYFFLQCCI